MQSAEASPATSAIFNDPDADIILRSADLAANASPTGIAEAPADYHIRKRRLAKFSETFSDMFDMFDKRSGEDAGNAPVVRLEEGATILETMLLYTSTDVDLFPDLQTKSNDMIISLWEAAVKYQIPSMQYIIELRLAAIIANMSLSSCSAVYAKAVKFNRSSLRVKAAQRLVRFPLIDWPADTLSSSDPDGVLSELLKAKKLHIQSQLQTIVKTHLQSKTLNHALQGDNSRFHWDLAQHAYVVTDSQATNFINAIGKLL